MSAQLKLRDAQVAAAGLTLLVVEFVLLAIWQRNGYWDFSDGVYADTARELLHGTSLYHGVAAAQPPPIYLVGAGLLAIHDGLASVRAGMAVAQLASAALVAYAVWRLSGRRWLAVVGGLALPLLPIDLHEHAQLIPEVVAAPLIMLGAICAARPRGALVAGALLALAAACKLAFVLPAILIVLGAGDRKRATIGLVGGGLGLGALALLGYGSPLWTETVRAQFEVGGASLHYVGGLLAQAVWNELPLLLGAAALLYARGRQPRSITLDAPLERTLLGAALGGLLLGLTLFKHGSYLSVFLVAEPPLLTLAAVGAAVLWQRSSAARVAIMVLALLLVAQSVSLLADPTDPSIARRPGAHSGLSEVTTPASVSRAVAAAQRCSARFAYAGAPYIAFLADRRMPGAQPDTFMLSYAGADGAFARRAAADEPRCL
ncbi:MAG: hypothetical protein ABSC56_08980 [Solirubrobacteraceae bacterium]